MSKGRSRSKLLTEVQKEPSQRSEYIEQTKEEKKNKNLEVELEIECPRCHDIMMDTGKINSVLKQRLCSTKTK